MGKKMEEKREVLLAGAWWEQGGCFLRLGIVDLEKKSYNIFIPKGRGVKGGWSSMAETLQSLGVTTGRIES